MTRVMMSTVHLQPPLALSSIISLILSTDGVDGFGYSMDGTAGDDAIASPSPSSAEDSERSGVEDGGGSGGGADNSWWVAAVGGAGVGLGVVLLGAVLFLKFGKKKDQGYDGLAKSAVSDTSLEVSAAETKAEPA